MREILKLKIPWGSNLSGKSNDSSPTRDPEPGRSMGRPLLVHDDMEPAASASLQMG